KARDLLGKLVYNRAVSQAQLDRVVALLDGHPLALELAKTSLNKAEDAAHVQEIVADYERGIRDGTAFDALNLELETPRTLNAVFARGYAALPDDLKAKFRAFGAFPPDAPWSRALAGAIWQIDDEKQLRDLHQALRAEELISTDEEANQRY